jgi:two-component system sensor histidine kinase KdpD
MTSGTTRGCLRVYLGAAPGVGKTFAMLSEGRRRLERGTDVVVGLVETRGRSVVAELVQGVETVPPLRRAGPHGRPSREVDVDAVIARRPQVALIDDLAEENLPGGRHARRWEDIEEVLAAGIDVVTTMNIEHLESLSDVVRSITGAEQRRSVPDEVVRRADQIELVDMTPEALRRRMAHGNVYAAEEVDAALSRYFRVGNLAALRELALLWLADRVDEGLERYRSEHDIRTTWAARERVVVALTGGPESETLLRRGARIASRGAGGELHAVYVATRGTVPPGPDDVARLSVLAEELGGKLHTVVSDDPGEAVLQLARSLNASQIIVGASRRRRWKSSLTSGVSDRIIADSGDVDVLVVNHNYAGRGPAAVTRRTALGRRRVVLGWVLAVAGPLTVTGSLLPSRHLPTLPLAAMLFLAATVLCALVGGLRPALAAALFGSFLLNWFFTPPHHTLTIADSVNLVALVLFVVLASAVASVVDAAARRSIEAELARHESDTLTMLNRTLLRSEHGIETILGLVRDTFGIEAAALLRAQDDGEWSLLGAVGDSPPAVPEHASDTAQISSTLTLALRGRVLPPGQRTVLAAFATHLAAALEREELTRRAEEARQFEEANRVRTALLAAVSHDLRTPLAGIKAAVSSLRSAEVEWGAEEEAELLAATEESADRLHRIVANLLDLSRLQADAVRPTTSHIGLEDVVSSTVAGMPQADVVALRLPDTLPPVRADAGLLDRVVENLVDNALRHGPSHDGVAVSISHVGDHVQLHVVDHGKGADDDQKERMFEPFRRVGDEQGPGGVGLGLAVAKGLTEAVGGRLFAEDTPGGGLTMILELPVAGSAEPLERL